MTARRKVSFVSNESAVCDLGAVPGCHAQALRLSMGEWAKHAYAKRVCMAPDTCAYPPEGRTFVGGGVGLVGAPGDVAGGCCWTGTRIFCQSCGTTGCW